MNEQSFLQVNASAFKLASFLYYVLSQASNNLYMIGHQTYFNVRK